MTLEPMPLSARSAPDLEQLIVAVAQGRDRLAFATLFGHFAPRVKSYLMRSGTHAARAEELAQETLMTVWRKADMFDPTRAKASTWIFVIARNLRIDALRRDRVPLRLDADPSDEPPAPLPADFILSSAQDQDRVREAFKELPEEQSRVIRMSFFLDMPHSQIAEELGIPLGTVKSRIRLALARLADRLGDCR